MRETTRRTGAALFAVTAVACSSRRATAPAPDPTLITTRELVGARARHAYQAVQRLRPHFLRVRRPGSLPSPSTGMPLVFVEGVRLGGVEVLADIPIGDVARIKYVPAWEATARFGGDHAQGVIEVIKRSRP